MENKLTIKKQIKIQILNFRTLPSDLKSFASPTNILEDMFKKKSINVFKNLAITLRINRVPTKSLFSQPFFQYKNFPYKFQRQLNITSKDFCCKYYRRLSRIFLYGKSGCKKVTNGNPEFSL